MQDAPEGSGESARRGIETPLAPGHDTAYGERSGRFAGRVLWATLALATALAAYHFVLAWLMRHAGLVLGVVSPGTKVYRLVPLYCEVDLPRRFNLGLPVAVAAVVGFWRWFRSVAWDVRRLRRGFVPAAMAWYVALACLVAMIDGGFSRLARPYKNLHETDYIGAVDRVESVRGFLAEYNAIQPTLPMHCRTHPPGGVLFLWAAGRCAGPGPMAAALATILAAALAVPAVYGLAREVGSRRMARLATALFILAPNVLLFTATSMEAVFMVPMIWTFYLLFRGGHERPIALGLAGGVAASLAALLTFSAAWLAIWAAALTALTAAIGPGRLARTLLAMASAAAASLAFYALLWTWSGYNMAAVLRTGIAQHAQIMEGGNQATLGQYLHLTVANPVAFFEGTGLVLAVLWGMRTWGDVVGGILLGRTPRNDGSSEAGCGVPPSSGTLRWTAHRDARGTLLNLSFLASLAVVVAAPLYTLEVERIWIFLVPLVAIAAARQLTARAARTAGPTAAGAEDTLKAIRTTFVLLAGQAVVMEAVLNTLW